MRIGIDIDDTIMNTFEKMLVYADIYDKDVLHKNGRINNTSNNSYLQDIYDWSYDNVIDFLNKYWFKLIQECSIKKDASKYINKLYDEGNEIYIITARSKYFTNKNNNVELATKEFLNSNNIPYKNIIFESNDKVKPCLENNIDIFIDDSPNICNNLNKVGIKTYLMDSITNKNINIDNIERVYNWEYLYNKIKEYQEGRR